MSCRLTQPVSFLPTSYATPLETLEFRYNKDIMEAVKWWLPNKSILPLNLAVEYSQCIMCWRAIKKRYLRFLWITTHHQPVMIIISNNIMMRSLTDAAVLLLILELARPVRFICNYTRYRIFNFLWATTQICTPPTAEALSKQVFPSDNLPVRKEETPNGIEMILLSHHSPYSLLLPIGTNSHLPITFLPIL